MKIKYQTLTYTALCLLSPLLITLLLINSTSALTQTSTANAAIRVRSTCSMTATIDSGNEHTATMINGQYKEDIGLTTIQTFCNDPNGYAIYAIGYTGGDTGVANGTNTVLHSTALGSTYDIVTGIATSGDISNWAMKITALNGTHKPIVLNSYDNYHIIPTWYEPIAKFISNTDSITGSSLTTTYSAYISPTQLAGTYEGQIKYILLHPSELSDAYYMQDVQNWGSTIAVGEEITALDNRDLKSYTIRRACTTKTTEEDVCPIANSILWMTQNLDLDLDTNSRLNSENTDLNVALTNNTYSEGYSIENNIIYWTPLRSTTKNIYSSVGSFMNWLNDNYTPYSADPDRGDSNDSWYITGELYNSNLCYINSSSQTCNYLNKNSSLASNYFRKSSFVDNGNHGKIGNYYNFAAAAASNKIEKNLSYYTPQNSICPKGWRLPSSNDWNTIKSAYIGATEPYDFAKLIGNPFYLTRAGYIAAENTTNGVLQQAGYVGQYWNRRITTGSYADFMAFRGYSNDNYYGISVGGMRASGKSIRCVSNY